MRTISIFAAMIVLSAAIACDTEPPMPAPTEPASQPAVPAADRPAAPDPEYTLAVSSTATDPKTYKVTWTAEVNTGGWKMTTEQVLVEESMRKVTARVYVILEEPGPDEMVTQAQQTLTGTHDAGTTQVDAAELSVKRTRRGSQSTFAPLYVVVKRTS